MKRIGLMVIFVLFLLLIGGCNKQQQVGVKQKELKQMAQVCKQPLKINSKNIYQEKLLAKVISDNQVNVVSSKAGIIKNLNCVEGKEVNKGEEIAFIQPDYSDPNVISLINQKKSLQIQKENVLRIIQSTKDSFNAQLQSLYSQKVSLEKQIKILQQNLKNLEQQKIYSLGDLATQLSGLNQQLQALLQSKQKLEKAKEANLKKIYTSLANAKKQIDILIGDVLEKVDEIYGISDKNKHKNDSFEVYLSAKNVALKEQVKSEWEYLNGKYSIIDQLTGQSYINFVKRVIDFLDLVKQSIKASVSTYRFPDTMINEFYSMFLELQNTLLGLFNNYTTLLKTYKSTKANYDVQLKSLDTQILNIQTTITNIKENKFGNVNVSLDSQINQLKNQILAFQSNLDNINNQIKSLESQKQSQINQLNNQLSQIEASLKNIEVSLAPQKIVSPIKGKVQKKLVSIGDKIGPGKPLCIIIGEDKGRKLLISSYIKIPIGTKINFKSHNKVYTGIINYLLPYKEPVTNNYLYQTNEISGLDLPVGSEVLANIYLKNESNKIMIPLAYIVSRLDGYFVKIKTNTGVIFRKVSLGQTDIGQAEILSGLKAGEILCK